MRDDNRKTDDIRPISFQTGFQVHPAGSVLACFGNTRVICAASVVEGVPRWMYGEKDSRGWLTAEYQMLPGATHQRATRELSKGRPSGRSSEIQRLIGRSLRMTMDLTKIPGKTIYVDCDVLDADGGTRCASVTGGCVAVEIALQKLFATGEISDWPMKCRVAAISVGIVDGQPTLDLCYVEDSNAEVDMNVVMTSTGHFVELQGTAESNPFSREQMDTMVELARAGIDRIFEEQKQAVKDATE